jgi:hypothetical protein
MKPRSPVLGYNHNVRYAGRLWHVQTEDSGVANPHIFTHLFHEGTILATKRADYDPTSDVGAVQKVMQVQHKAMLRDLKAGAFDEKITRFFGTPIVKEREDQTDPGASLPISGEFDTAPKTDPTMQAPTSASSPRVPQVEVPPPRVAVPVEPPPARTASSPAAYAPTLQRGPMPAPPPSRPNLTPSRPAIPVAASRSSTPSAPSHPHSPRAPVTGIGGRRAQSGQIAHP